eukprot:426316_1
MFSERIDIENQVKRLIIRIEVCQYIKFLKIKQKKWKKYFLKTNINNIPNTKSLLIFSNRNKIRIFLHKIAKSIWFETFISILILINCVVLAMETKRTLANDKSHQLFNWLNIFFTIIFVLEFLIKIIAFGAFEKQCSFCRKNKRKWTRIKDDKHLTAWTDTAFKSVQFMNYWNSEILPFPGLIVEGIKSNDGYVIVQFWSVQLLRIVYYNERFAMCYKLNNSDSGEFGAWHPKLEENKLDNDLIKISTSFNLTEDNPCAYFASNWNRLDAMVVFIAI